MKIISANFLGALGLSGLLLPLAGRATVQSSSCSCPILGAPTNGAQVEISAPWALTGNYAAANNPAYFTLTVDSGPTVVPAGKYLAWCVDAPDNIDAGPSTYSTLLWSSCDPNLNQELGAGYPASVYVSPDVWNQVNYLLNHKNGAYFWNIQMAIWRLIGGPAPSEYFSSPYPPTTQSEVDALVADAQANAANWQPQCGDKTAVVVQVPKAGSSPLIQLVILELPCCSVNFTTCVTDMDLGCNPSQIPDCDPTQVAASSCCGRPVTITCQSADTTVGCKTFRLITYTATDDAGHSATCSQTITWTTDTTPPTITAPPGGDLGCNPNPAALPTDDSIKAQVTAKDGCNGGVTITVTHVDAGTPCAMSRTFTITAIDACKNSAPPAIVVYTWKANTTPPTIGGIPSGSDLGCNPANLPTDASVAAQVTALDACGGVAQINVSHTDSGTPCAMIRTFSITASDSCGNGTAPVQVVFTWKADQEPPVVTCPPDVTVPVPTIQCCTYPQETWRTCTTLNTCFSKLYSSGYLQCGLSGWWCHSIKFSSCDAIRAFLPCSGSAGSLTYDCYNPTYCSAGEFAGEVLCLKLNVDCGDNPSVSGFSGGCGDLVYHESGSPCDGKKVRDILDICNKALGGGGTSGCTFSLLNTLCYNVNHSFDCGKPSTWCKAHLCPPPNLNIPPSQTGYATAKDNCDANPTVTYTDSVTPGACTGTYIISRTWKAVDSCGNAATCTQTISIGNTTGSVCGNVFLDCDGSGDLTGGDTGLGNIVVTLKDSSGQVVATTTTDANGAYCFYGVNAGTYTVVVTPPAGYVQSAGSTSYHWKDANGQTCWWDNDNYQHCKGSNGVDYWTASDGCQHWKDSYGRDCWKDRYGYQHSQPCNYVSCDSRKDNTETVTVGPCDAKTCIDFAYYGSSCKGVVCVTGPSKARCGDTITYTCTVSNTGTQCFAGGCRVYICGKYYTCPNISPGGSCSFQVPYQVGWYDCGSHKCQATAYCYPSSGNPCTTQSYCTTSVSWY